MPTLQIRDLPADVYHKLAEAAEREHRSLAQQAIALLERSLIVSLSPRQRRRARLEAIRDSGVHVRFQPGNAPEELIREDRER